MATDLNQTAEPVGKPNVSGVMSRKDRLSLLFSLLALVISATTLVWNRVDKQREADDKEATASYHAYELGKRFATSFIIYTQVGKGDPKEVEAAKAEALEFSRTAQSAADQLELRMDVESIIKSYNPKGGIIGEGIIDSIENRMRGVNGAKVTGRFTLGFYLTWLAIESQIGATDYPQDMPRFKQQGYPAFASSINEQLEALDIEQRLSREMPAVEVLSQQIELIRTTVEAKLAENKG